MSVLHLHSLQGNFQQIEKTYKPQLKWVWTGEPCTRPSSCTTCQQLTLFFILYFCIYRCLLSERSYSWKTTPGKLHNLMHCIIFEHSSIGCPIESNSTLQVLSGILKLIAHGHAVKHAGISSSFAPSNTVPLKVVCIVSIDVSIMRRGVTFYSALKRRLHFCVYQI